MESGVLRAVRIDPQKGFAELSGVSYLLRGSNPPEPRQIQPCQGGGK